MSGKKTVNLRILSFIIGFLMFIALGIDVHILFAESQLQTEDNVEPWSDPLNLSQSGTAFEPRFIIDTNGVVHVIWREDAAGSFYYTREEDGEWRTPIAVELPFGTRRYATNLRVDDPTPLYNPVLLADGNGRIHAFWLGEKNALFSSSVMADQFEVFANWSDLQQLATSAVDLAVTLDGDNNIHLSYLRDIDTPEASAGVYYRKMNGEDLSWSQALSLHESAYYRGLEPFYANVDIATTNIAITTTGFITESIIVTDSESISNTISSSSVIVASDNRPVEKVFVSHSLTGGEVWFEPLLLDERNIEDSEFSVGPALISVSSMNDEVHLTWLAGHETNCEQYHQWSIDNGLTWNLPVIIPSEQQECPERYELLPSESGLLFLLGFREEEAYLQVWNGSSWSEPEIQPPLTRIIDSITNRQLSLGCQQTAVTDDDHLIVVGCSTGAGGVSDVWLLERPLGDEDVWFPPQEALVWQEPELLFDSIEDEIVSPILLPGKDGLLHVFWIGSEMAGIEGTNARVFYSQWDGDVWSRPVSLLHLDSPEADQLQGILDENGHIILLWRNPESNSYFTRQVIEQRVLFPADWSLSQEVFEEALVVDYPDMYMDRNGMIGVIYARPLNENRGIYLLQSHDEDLMASESNLVFDAAASDWEMAGGPQIAQTENNDFHAIVTRFELRPEPNPTSIYYLTSKDAGETWSQPTSIADGNILWSEIASIDEQVLLVVWQQDDGDQIRIIARQSFDGGVTWGDPNLVLSTDVPTSQPILLIDQNNQAHLLQMFILDDTLALQERTWQGGDWAGIEYYPFADKLADTTLMDFAATIFLDDQLFTTFAVETNLENSEGMISTQFITNRQIEVPENTTIPQPLVVSAPVMTPTLVSEPTQEPIFTQETADNELETAVNTSSPTSLPLLIVVGLVPVILLVGGVLIVMAIRAYRSR